MLEKICNANNLWNAFDKASEDVRWKESVQRFDLDRLQNIRRLQKSIREGTYKQKPCYEFEIKERGHARHIKSLHISDRVVQRSLNDNVLMPAVAPKLIYDNGASVKGKGTSFSIRRFGIMLREAYIEYGENAVVLQIDFSKYFDNIVHEKALEMYKPLLNESEFDFVKQCFKEFEIDVSYMSDEEYSACMSVVFNSLIHSKVPRSKLTREKFMAKSVGIGNQLSQVTGIFYPHRIDNYCKIVKGIPYYERFMDDTSIILPTKEEAVALLNEIIPICNELGITINYKKTHIKKITDTITFLKVNYRIVEGDKVVRKVHNSSILRERRRLRKFQRLVLEERIPLKDVENWFKSWYGHYKKFDSGYKLYRLKQYYFSLFGGYYYEYG